MFRLDLGDKIDHFPKSTSVFTTLVSKNDQWTLLVVKAGRQRKIFNSAVLPCKSELSWVKTDLLIFEVMGAC